MRAYHIETSQQRDYNSSYGARCDLHVEGDDRDQMVRLNIKRAWYWYSTGSYEGNGSMIAELEDGTWAVKDLGHCSCYGPLEGNWDMQAPSLQQLELDMLHDEYAELFEAAKGAA